MLDQLRRDMQARLEDLLGEIDVLRRALAALTSSEGETARSDRAAPASGTAGESVTKSTRRVPRTRTASAPSRPSATAPGSPTAGPARAPGATKGAIIAALKDGAGAMTAGEIAAATGLARASVSTTLSKLAASGEIAKAARGYQLQRESDTARKPARPRLSVSTVAASPSPQVAEPQVAEPPAAEPQVATRHAVLAAFARGSAMTADEVATATGLGRASVSSTLSQLAKAGELRNAARGYQLASVEAAQRFYFRIEDDATPRVVVANLPELEAAIAVCEPGVLRDHCAEQDFSRWVAGVLHNERLADAIAAAEAQLAADSPSETVERARGALTAALQARHATQR